MKKIILDTLLDGIKLLPFLFVTFLFIEILEQNFTNKTSYKCGYKCKNSK